MTMRGLMWAGLFVCLGISMARVLIGDGVYPADWIAKDVLLLAFVNFVERP